MHVSELQTPALIVDSALLDANIALMAKSHPGPRLRPHVKAHKTTELARRQVAAGHTGFTCATIREVEGMAAAGLGGDLLLANEVADARRLGVVVDSGARVTLAVDSEATVRAAVLGGVREVVIDVNIGLPRCGAPAEMAGPLAELARSLGLEVRGVMGYEGHLMQVQEDMDQDALVEASMAILLKASADVGGELVSAGGTGTYLANKWASEIQAGSYALMDSTYATTVPFAQALHLLTTVISVSDGWAVCDIGLKSHSMDHGNPTIKGAAVWFCADEHTVFAAEQRPRVGDKLQAIPAHIDPTVAMHQRMHVIEDDTVIDTWEVDLRGW